MQVPSNFSGSFDQAEGVGDTSSLDLRSAERFAVGFAVEDVDAFGVALAEDFAVDCGAAPFADSF